MHNHTFQGVNPDCPACSPIRPETQTKLFILAMLRDIRDQQLLGGSTMLKTEPIMARTTPDGRFIVEEAVARSTGVTIAAILRHPTDGVLTAEIDPVVIGDREPNIIITDATGLELAIPATVFRRWASTALKILEGVDRG